MEPPRLRLAIPRRRHGRAVPAGADHAGLGPDGRRRHEDDPGPVHRRDAGRRARAVPRRGAAAREPGRPLRQLPDRRLSAHGRRHGAGGDDGDRDDGRAGDRGRDPAAARSHRHPRLRGRRAGAAALRRLSRTSAGAATTRTSSTSPSTPPTSTPAACRRRSATTWPATSTRRPASRTTWSCSAASASSGPRTRRASWCRAYERHRLRAAGGDGLAPAQGRHDRVRRRRRAAAGRRPRPAAPRAEADDGDRGRDHRAADPTRAAAGLDQRDARGPSRPDAARHHRHVPVRPARLPRLRLHGRRPDRHVRQHQHERGRQRLLEAEGAAARHRRRQRHRLALPRGLHPDRAREAAVRAPRGLRDEPGLARRRRRPPASGAAVRRRVARGDDARHLRLRPRQQADARGGRCTPA